MKIGTTAWADDPKRGMTLYELAEFVHTAMHDNVPGDAIVRIESTWRSSIKRAEVKGGSKPKEQE